VRVFNWATAGEGSVPALVYLPLPLLLWAAVRFGPIGVNTSLMIVALISISGAVQGRGPFAASTPGENVLSLQLFLVVISLPLMLMAALIEERRASTNVLRESEARFRSMADTAPVLAWMADPDKLRNFFNTGWLDFTGRTLEQELGTGWSAGIHPEDLDGCLRTYGDAFDRRREFTLEYRLRRRDGHCRFILDKGRPRFGPDGAFLGYIGSAIDISELRGALTEIQELKDRLELENAYLRQETIVSHSHEGIVGESAAMARVLRQVEQVAGTGATVLLLERRGRARS
jgi:PAS domain S-box-containing protein